MTNSRRRYAVMCIEKLTDIGGILFARAKDNTEGSKFLKKGERKRRMTLPLEGWAIQTSLFREFSVDEGSSFSPPSFFKEFTPVETEC